MLPYDDPTLLRIPGPTPIPPSIQRAMNQPMIGHRGSEANALFQNIKDRMKPIFGTEQPVMIVTGSGTSGLETAVVNTASAGDEVLVIVTGAFGDRFATICEEYDLVVHRLETAWGEAVNVEQVKDFLIKHPNIKVVFSTYCETSTGVLNPVKEISEIVQEYSNALVVVDGVSSVGGVVTKMDDWGIDIVVSGSQKAMMLPTGLAFVAVSERAWKVIDNNKQPRYYLDLRKYRDTLLNNSTPFTPGLSLLLGLEEALNLLEEEGLASVYGRHKLMMNMTRAAMKAIGIPLLASDTDASPTVTAIQPSFDPEKLREETKQDFGLSLAGGQQHLKGKIIRIGHMGYCTPAHVLQVISMLEVSLQRLNIAINPGEGVAAAQAVYLKAKDDSNEI